MGARPGTPATKVRGRPAVAMAAGHALGLTRELQENDLGCGFRRSRPPFRTTTHKWPPSRRKGWPPSPRKGGRLHVGIRRRLRPEYAPRRSRRSLGVADCVPRSLRPALLLGGRCLRASHALTQKPLRGFWYTARRYRGFGSGPSTTYDPYRRIRRRNSRAVCKTSRLGPHAVPARPSVATAAARSYAAIPVRTTEKANYDTMMSS
jgi:hypothetical protein